VLAPGRLRSAAERTQVVEYGLHGGHARRIALAEHDLVSGLELADRLQLELELGLI
jgi:hypothetical protein